MANASHELKTPVAGIRLLSESLAQANEAGDTNATLIVNNLIDNAIAYTDEGSVNLSISVEGGSAVLVVADTGIGIPPADRERVFERFYRVDTAYGLAQNSYAGNVQSEITANDLFA